MKLRTQQALAFLELCGLSGAKLKVKDDKVVSYNLDMGSDANVHKNSDSDCFGYDFLSNSDKEKVEKIL